jgi:hypothetical protein
MTVTYSLNAIFSFYKRLFIKADKNSQKNSTSKLFSQLQGSSLQLLNPIMWLNAIGHDSLNFNLLIKGKEILGLHVAADAVSGTSKTVPVTKATFDSVSG